MGIYNLKIGKGVIIPVTYFMSIFLENLELARDSAKEENPDYVEFEFDEDFILKCIFEKTGIKYNFSPLGHDAFDSRNGTMNILGGTKNSKVFNQIKELKSKKYENINDDFCCVVGTGDLIFIGFYTDLNEGGEFEYYVKAPEIIYGLTSLLDQILEVVPKLKEKKCTELEKLFNQEALIWSFASDCSCCG